LAPSAPKFQNLGLFHAWNSQWGERKSSGFLKLALSRYI
jgi:hypothetical protein